jgi:hypothetical protein
MPFASASVPVFTDHRSTLLGAARIFVELRRRDQSSQESHAECKGGK